MLGSLEYRVLFALSVACGRWGERLLPLPVTWAAFIWFGARVTPSPGLLELLFPPVHL